MGQQSSGTVRQPLDTDMCMAAMTCEYSVGIFSWHPISLLIYMDKVTEWPSEVDLTATVHREITKPWRRSLHEHCPQRSGLGIRCIFNSMSFEKRKPTIKIFLRTRELAWELIVSLSLVPRTHIMVYHIYDSSSWGSNAFFWSPWVLVHVYTCPNTYSCNWKQNIFFKKTKEKYLVLCRKSNGENIPSLI